jgi:hypothetical protein
MPLSVVTPPAQACQPRRHARNGGSRAVLVATMTGMLGLLGAMVVVVQHRRPTFTDMPGHRE